MIPKENAKELFDKFYENTEHDYLTKQCALIAVNYIIAANPHSNPFNTEVYSTMGYWKEVKEEIELL